MIALLHGYLLDGSGSNLWTQAVARSLCRIGEDVHVICQEREPHDFDFVAEARVYPRGSTVPDVLFRRDTSFPGRCVLHRPELGDTLPVYVPDRYEGFEHVVPMVDLPDGEIDAYVERNVAVLDAIVEAEGITAVHANHAVLMSVVAERVARRRGLPFAIMPHGSALEYAVKPDPRFRALARGALTAADVVFVIGDEMARRLTDVFPDLPGLTGRMIELPLGVDVDLFRPTDRDRRDDAVSALIQSIAPSERGRRPEQLKTLTDRLDAARPEEMEGLWQVAARYPGKLPDAGLEDELSRVDWAQDDVLLYVGRLIAAKGVQYVVAALPEVLRRHPTARLILVGHGPLREPLETMVWALEHGDEALLRRVVALGGRDDDAKGPDGFTAVAAWLDALAEKGELEAYLEAAADARVSDRVLFTGYLTHDRLRHLFSVADVAIFPSRVREAGPLVFLEAMAAGVFPLGTYFGGMAASIDAVAEHVPDAPADRMKLRTPDAPAGGIVSDIADRVSEALEDPAELGPRLRQYVEERHDWRAVARRLSDTLDRP